MRHHLTTGRNISNGYGQCAFPYAFQYDGFSCFMQLLYFIGFAGQ